MKRIRHVICCVNGSIESSVASFLLKKKGYHVTGLFCTHENYRENSDGDDVQRAADVCQHLDIPFQHLSVTAHQEEGFIKAIRSDLECGLSPGVALLYNRHIVFGKVLEYVTEELGGHSLATGHYVRRTGFDFTTPHQQILGTKLLRSYDLGVDESYLLSQVQQTALHQCIFPLGEFHRDIVHNVASTAGLHQFTKAQVSTSHRSSLEEKLSNILHSVIQELPQKTGKIVNVETYGTVGHHTGIYNWDVGCKVQIGSSQFTVVEKNPATNELIVSPDDDHSSQYAEVMFLTSVNWTQRTPYRFYRKQMMDCTFRMSVTDPLTKATLTVGTPSAWCGNDSIILSSTRMLRYITPGQYVALYQGEECLGGAKIMRAGPSLFAMNYKNNVKEQEEPDKKNQKFGSFIQRIF